MAFRLEYKEGGVTCPDHVRPACVLAALRMLLTPRWPRAHRGNWGHIYTSVSPLKEELIDKASWC